MRPVWFAGIYLSTIGYGRSAGGGAARCPISRVCKPLSPRRIPFLQAMTIKQFFSLLLFLSITLSGAASDKPKLTIDEFFNSVSFTAIQMSPAGDAVVIAAERPDWD